MDVLGPTMQSDASALPSSADPHMQVPSVDLLYFQEQSIGSFRRFCMFESGVVPDLPGSSVDRPEARWLLLNNG